MNTNYLIAGAEVVSAVIAAGAILVAARGLRTQLWLQTFADYTRRYSEIVRPLPVSSVDPHGDFDLAGIDVDARQRILSTARAYLNLCSEEFYLHERGLIDRHTWSIWRKEMEGSFSAPWLKQSWPSMRAEYTSYRPFVRFVDKCLVEE